MNVRLTLLGEQAPPADFEIKTTFIEMPRSRSDEGDSSLKVSSQCLESAKSWGDMAVN